MLTKEQVEFRKTGIGGSDVAGILNLSPYTQAIDVFYDKRPDLAKAHGFEPREVEGFAIDRGNLFEEPIAKLYELQTGNKVHKSNVMHRHPKYDWLIANIDRKIEGDRKGLEIKTVTNYLAHMWGPSGSDEVAEYYVPQPHHYMLVLDYKAWELAAMIGMDDLRVYDIERNPEWDEIIIESTHDFWHNNVLKGIPPEIDVDHKAAGDVLKRAYRQVTGEETILPDEAMQWHRVMMDAKDQAKQYEAIADGAKHHLLRLAGNAGIARIPGLDGGYTRKTVKRSGFTVEPTQYIAFKYSAKK